MSATDAPHPDDVLGLLLKNFTELKNLSISWQHGITSFEKCAKQDSVCQMQKLRIDTISELPPPADIGAFVNKHMASDGFLRLSFIIPFPDDYVEKIQSYIISKDFEVDVDRQV